MPRTRKDTRISGKPSLLPPATRPIGHHQQRDDGSFSSGSRRSQARPREEDGAYASGSARGGSC
eukprot:14260514-Ditylum_brightwellii.AAC.1